MNSVNEKKEMSQYKKAIVKLNEIAQIKRNVSKPESMKTSVKPPTPTSAKESFKPEHTNTTRKKCRFENRGKCKMEGAVNSITPGGHVNSSVNQIHVKKVKKM